MRQNATATTWLQRGLLAVLGTTLVVAGLQATGDSVATVNVADGTVWLATPTKGTLVQVSAASEQVLATVRVTANPGDSLTTVQDGHSALVLNRSSGEIGRVDGAALTYVDQQAFSGSSADFQLVSGGGRAYLVDTNRHGARARRRPNLQRGSDTPIDSGPRDSEVDSKGNLEPRRHPGQGHAHQAERHERHLDHRGCRRRRLDAHARERPAVHGMAGTGDEGGTVVALDEHSAKPQHHYCLDGADRSTPLLATGTGPADPRQLAVAVAGESGQVLTSDLQGRKCTVVAISDDSSAASSAGGSANGTGASYGQPVASGDLLFIPVLSAGAVIVVDTAENRIVRTIESKELFAGDSPDPRNRFKGQRFEFVADDGNVWFNDLDGPEASVLGRDGVALSVLKYEVKPGAKGTGDASQGLAATDDPNGLAVDIDPGSGTVEPRTGADNRVGADGQGGTGKGATDAQGANGSGTGSAG